MNIKEIEKIRDYCKDNPEFKNTELDIVTNLLLESIELLKMFNNICTSTYGRNEFSEWVESIEYQKFLKSIEGVSTCPIEEVKIGDRMVVARIPSKEELENWDGDFTKEMYESIGYKGRIFFLDEDSIHLDNGFWYPKICLIKCYE